MVAPLGMAAMEEFSKRTTRVKKIAGTSLKTKTGQVSASGAASLHAFFNSKNDPVKRSQKLLSRFFDERMGVVRRDSLLFGVDWSGGRSVIHLVVRRNPFVPWITLSVFPQQQYTTSTQRRGSVSGSHPSGWTRWIPPRALYTSSTVIPASLSGNDRRGSSPSFGKTRSPQLRSRTLSSRFCRRRGQRCVKRLRERLPTWNRLDVRND